VALARQNGGPDSYRDRFALILSEAEGLLLFLSRKKEEEKKALPHYLLKSM
jgi:hypothetical protein